MLTTWLVAGAIQALMAAWNYPYAFGDDPHTLNAVAFGFCAGLAFSSLGMAVAEMARRSR